MLLVLAWLCSEGVRGWLEQVWRNPAGGFVLRKEEVFVPSSPHQAGGWQSKQVDGQAGAIHVAPDHGGLSPTEHIALDSSTAQTVGRWLIEGLYDEGPPIALCRHKAGRYSEIANRCL